ncbi:hypothetical protein evm_015559 [Chilo suppressalis]|nr:hypothetical protein evm_015559 [Chilo suppressalis]
MCRNSSFSSILDLALILDNNDNDDSTSNRNTHDENSNLEPDDPCDTAMSSPLPPGARNIKEDMAEVWNDVFNNNYPIDFSQYQLQATYDTTFPC